MCGSFRRKALINALALLAAAASAGELVGATESVGAAEHAGSAVRVGQPLAQALEALGARGLRVIFSSALIEPQLTVKADPGEGAPEEIARRVLAPYGLTLEAIHPGLYSVVRRRDEPDSTATVPLPPPEPEGEGVDTVSVYASRYAIEARKSDQGVQFTRDELDALPGIEEDVMRVTRYLPGTASNALSGRTHVRGGRENELAVYFDGAPLYEPFHFKDVQGLLGILEPQSISTADFYSGVFPARYGNRMSGVLDIKPREWGGERYNAIGASLLYTHALSQGRMKSQPLEWLVSVRRGNLDLLAEALDRDEARPDFIDALGRVEFHPEGRSSVAVGWLLLDDGLRAEVDDEEAEIGYRDSTGWINWRLDPDDEGRELSATVSHTERHTWRNGSVERVGSATGFVNDRRTSDTTTARLEGSWRRNDRLSLTAGLEWYDYLAHYEYGSELSFDPALAQAFGKPEALSRYSDFGIDGEAFAAHASMLFGITPRVLLDVGARWDGQRFGAAFDANQLSPRISIRFQRDPATTLRLSWGRFSQTERPDELAVQDGDPGFHPAQRSSQIVASLERRPTPNVLVRLEAYDKRVTTPAPDYENLLDPFALLPELAVDRVRIDPDRSHAYGAEMSLRWELPPAWLAWASYSRSQVQDEFGAVRVPRTWDQKHALVAGLNWTHGYWGLSANAMWHSGWRRNQLNLLSAEEIALAPRNSDRWGDYLSIDLRGTWSRPISAGTLQLFLEVDNVANHGNPCCADYRVSGATDNLGLTRELSSWLPRIVLVGATWQLP